MTFTVDIHPRAAFLMHHMGDFHLHVVLYDLDAYGLCLLAPISSIKHGRYFDPACVLENTDHEFLKRRSYVVYERIMQPRNLHTRRMLEAGLYKPKDPVEDEVFRRIVDGIFISDDVKRRVVRDVRSAGLNPRA